MKGAKEAAPRTRWVGAALGIGLLMLSLGTVPAIRATMSGIATKPRVALVPGRDSSAVCVSFPCGQASVQNGGSARVSMSLGVESDEALQAETYYTDLLQLNNPTTTVVSVASVTVSGVSYTRSGDLGQISVYYCPQETDDPAGNCLGSFSISSGSGGAVYSGGYSMAPGATVYLEFAGYAGTGAHPGDSISFDIQVSSQ